MTTVNWGKLVSQGRAKATGIPWSDEELKAVYELKIPADYVRKGILTVGEYEKAKAKGIELSKSKEELMEEAKKEGISFTPEVDKETLAREIEKKKAEKTEKVGEGVKPKTRKRNVGKTKTRTKKA